MKKSQVFLFTALLAVVSVLSLTFSAQAQKRSAVKKRSKATVARPLTTYQKLMPVAVIAGVKSAHCTRITSITGKNACKAKAIALLIDAKGYDDLTALQQVTLLNVAVVSMTLTSERMTRQDAEEQPKPKVTYGTPVRVCNEIDPATGLCKPSLIPPMINGNLPPAGWSLIPSTTATPVSVRP